MRRRRRTGIRLVIFPRSHFLPSIRLVGNFDLVLDRQPIGELFLAVATPNDTVDGHHFRQVDLHPTAAALVGYPASLVTILAVVDVLDLVSRIALVIARRTGPATGRCQGHVPRGRFRRHFVDFQLIQARFRIVVRGQNRETHGPRRRGRKRFLVPLRVDRRPLAARLGGRQMQVIHVLAVDPAQGSLFVLHARKDGLQRVVVALGNRIELVVVAAGTADGQPQH